MDLNGDGSDDFTRSDRAKVIGSGIPAGPVPILQEGSGGRILSNAGSGILAIDAASDIEPYDLYWRKK